LLQRLQRTFNQEVHLILNLIKKGEIDMKIRRKGLDIASTITYVILALAAWMSITNKMTLKRLEAVLTEALSEGG
jgi:hypothetical protein